MIKIQEMSYSFHIGNDKNKTKVGRKTARSSQTNSTSFSNNAIQNKANLTKVDNHNLRKYDNDKELIKTIIGSDSIVNDVKDLYKDLFDKAKEEYNSRQTRNDRKIDDYFEHIANDDKHDLACEIIIELGDMTYWEKIDDSEKKKMIDVYQKQCADLEMVVPNFKIANATIHFDESSPHLHVIGVAYKDSNKNGMYKQVGKATVFNKESLVKIQDEMRERCIEAFNRIYKVDYVLKDKEQGRNKDINVKDMENYSKFKKEKEKCDIELNRLNKSANNLKDNSKEVLELLHNLKPTTFNKNAYHLSDYEKRKLENFIKEANESTKDMLSTNHLNAILKQYEENLNTYNDNIAKYQAQLINRNDRIDKLEKDLNTEKINYIKLKDNYNHECYDNLRLNDVIDATKSLYNGLCNMIYHLCADGLIPQKTYDEFSELFNDNKGKWINGKYYTKEQLEKLKQQKNNGYAL